MRRFCKSFLWRLKNIFLPNLLPILPFHSEEHHKRVHEFFWTNKLDMKKRDKYKLKQEKLESLEDKSKKNLDKFTEDSLQAIKEVRNLLFKFKSFYAL